MIIVSLEIDKSNRENRKLKITYLGQAGLLFEAAGATVMIDPYLSNSVETLNPSSYRRQPIEERFFNIKPDVMIFTHNHLDHYDPETVQHFITRDSRITVLAPTSVWEEVRNIDGSNNYVLFNRHTSWTEKGITFTAVKAEHSDPAAIGVILDARKRKYYITGDTLYNEEIFRDIPEDIYALFLPVNGAGNNMNITDAARFSQRVQAQKVVPIHVGLLDDLDAGDFSCENKVIAEIYKEVKL